MVGTGWVKLTLCLLASVYDANGLLTRREQAPGPCSNSDGISGYNFSHRGLWIPGYQLAGTGFSKLSCSAKCSNINSCVAFSGAFKEDGGNGACYTYAATGGNVPSATDQAYKKCLKSVATVTGGPVGMHLVAKKVVKTKATTEEDLIKMAEKMEADLDKVTKTMGDADLRMRRLKSMVAGTAAMLTDAGRRASAVSGIALGNRGGLMSIARARQEINTTFGLINSSNASIARVLFKVENRAPKRGQASTGPSLAVLAPNVTALETKMNKLNDPATLKAVSGLVESYNNLTSTIGSTVKVVLRNHLRGLVDTQREALYNYTTALQDNKKDPCCCKGCCK